MLYLLRVSVPDRPGALGLLAGAIGSAGGDITAVDVVEREASSAIDDILIETPDATSAAAILSTVSALAGVVIETWQLYTEGDQLRDGLDIVDGLGSTSSRALAAITRIAPAVLRARWVVVIEDVSGGVAITHASSGAPWGRWAALPWLPLATARSIHADPSWLPHEWGADPQLAAAPIGESQMTLLAIRPTGPRFRWAEISRLANLAAVAALATPSVLSAAMAEERRPTAGSGSPFRPPS